MSPPGSGCKRGCGRKGLSVKLGLCCWEQKVLQSLGGTFIPSLRLVEREEGLLSYPLLALGSVGGCRYSLPVQSSSLHIWKKIKLGTGSACQCSSAS